MKLSDKLKLKRIYQSTGRMKEYEEYKQAIELEKSDINRYSKYLKDASQKFQTVQKNFPEDSKEYISARDEMYRWKYTLDESMLSFKYIRPNSQEDIEYRKRNMNNFTTELKKVLSSNLDLRFHGTPIYFAEQIIKSGTISSSADRYDGYINSTDRMGEISVSDIESLDRTINFFSDMAAYQRNLPAGCIFAILPNGTQDECMRKQSLMPSINFKQNPEQLFGVFTTPENVKNVKEWMQKSGFNENLAYTFEEFLQVVKETSQTIDENVTVQSKAQKNKLEETTKSPNDKENDMEMANNHTSVAISTESLARIDKNVNAKERQEAFNVIKSARLEMSKEVIIPKEKGEEK